MDIAGDAVERQAGQFRQRLLEQHHIAGEQRAQDHAGGELPALRADAAPARRLPRRASRRRARRSPSRRPRARRIRRVRSPSIAAPATKPASVCDSLASSAWRVAIGRSSRASERLADRRQMAEALDDAVDGERRDIGVGIFQKRQTGLRRADFGDGRGERARQHGAAGDGRLRRRLTGGDQIDQIGFRAAAANAPEPASRFPADRRRARAPPPAAPSARRRTPRRARAAPAARDRRAA